MAAPGPQDRRPVKLASAARQQPLPAPTSPHSTRLFRSRLRSAGLDAALPVSAPLCRSRLRSAGLGSAFPYSAPPHGGAQTPKPAPSGARQRRPAATAARPQPPPTRLRFSVLGSTTRRRPHHRTGARTTNRSPDRTLSTTTAIHPLRRIGPADMLHLAPLSRLGSAFTTRLRLSVLGSTTWRRPDPKTGAQ